MFWPFMTPENKTEVRKHVVEIGKSHQLAEANKRNQVFTGATRHDRELRDFMQKAQQTGWICPVCGHGLAPSVKRCPCKE